jgi:8-oxo-dGTP pyrophosphatase MutT (NUDIX family)
MTILGAFAIIFDREGRVLLGHRRDMEMWNLPGGRPDHESLSR